MRIFFTAVLAAMTVFFAACGNDQPPVEVAVANVISADETLSITYDGRISLSGEKKILSPVSGNVVATFFERGQDVTEGQPLFQIGRKEDATALLQARTALTEAMTALARAQSELAQAQAKFRQHSATEQDVAEKSFAVEDSLALLDERRAHLQQLEEASAAGTVFAPVAGHIGVETVPLGSPVTANETVLAAIGATNPAAVRIEISDDEKHLLQTSPALKITLKLADGSTYPRTGNLQIEASTAEIIFDNPTGRLLLGDDVQISIDGLNAPKTLLVPESAVHQRDGGNFVFVVDSNKTAALKKLSLGGKLGKYFIVNDGLKAGDSVIVEGLTKLREGTPLKFRDEGQGTRD